MLSKMRQTAENDFHRKFGKDRFYLWMIDRSINNFKETTAEPNAGSAVFKFPQNLKICPQKREQKPNL